MSDSCQQEIVLVLAADNQYAMPLAVAAKSAIINLNKMYRLRIFVFDGGISFLNHQRILRSLSDNRVEIEWVKIRSLPSSELPICEKYPQSIYYRLLISDCLPPSVKKVIYLDSDLVVLGDLSRLWTSDVLNSVIVAAVPCLCQRYIANAIGLINCHGIAVSENLKYFNSGVMLIDLGVWRRERITPKIFSFLEQHPEVWRFPDQDAINAILAGRIGELSPQWNQMPAIYSYANWMESPYDEATYRAALEQPDIVHYATLPKPWQRGCRHPLQPLFYHYLDMTAWQGWRNTVWRRAWRKLRTLAS